MIDIDYLKQLLQIFDESTVNDLRIDKEGTSIRLTKTQKKEGADQVPYHYVAAHPAPPLPAVIQTSAEVTAPTSAPVAGTGKTEGTPKQESQELPTGHVITSPIVGTFYSAPSPDADPFVEVGTRVKKGTVLCIIEAMKLMNEIESDVDGVVTQIYPQNGQAIEFGEPIFLIQE